MQLLPFVSLASKGLAQNYIFVDESIHENLGFIVSAFVCSKPEINDLISSNLVSANMRPGVDEFKSSYYMKGRPNLQALRDRLICLARTKCKIALLFSSSRNRSALGDATIAALNTIALRNGLYEYELSVFFDQNIVRSVKTGSKIAEQVGIPSSVNLYFNQDSRRILGIQIADAVASLSGQILRERVSGMRKSVHIGGPDTGYEEGVMADLGWSLLMDLRYSFFVQQVILGDRMDYEDSERNPLIVSTEDELIEKSMNPQLYGWGVFISSDLNPKIRAVVESMFKNLWLGCIH